MNTSNFYLIREALSRNWILLKDRVKLVLLKVVLLILLFLLITNQKIEFHISFSDATNYSEKNFQKKKPVALNTSTNKNLLWWNKLRYENNLKNIGNMATVNNQELSAKELKKANSYSNLGFILNPGYVKRHNINPKIVHYKKRKCLDYINRYLSIAKEEAKLFGIPVSITLAQGLLESNAGDSKLSRIENNHFGIKCKKKCLGCKCANYTDDSKYDMFRVFDTAWESFREHSKILMGKRYSHLRQIKMNDYKNWARGLKAAGYATDKKYDKKIIMIIEKLNLNKLDD